MNLLDIQVECNHSPIEVLVSLLMIPVATIGWAVVFFGSIKAIEIIGDWIML